MTKKSELKRATQRVTTKKPGFFTRAWNFIRGVDVVCAVNILLLGMIIVIFSMLILDICDCNRSQNNARPNITRNAQPAATTPNIAPAAPRKITVVRKTVSTITLPLGKKNTPSPVAAPVQKPIGPTIIAGVKGDTKLSRGNEIHGNLYLEDMRRYTLPCGLRVNGDLFVRNVGILKFCGAFTVTGNIYVTPSSSFGTIPRNAKIGGKIIL